MKAINYVARRSILAIGVGTLLMSAVGRVFAAGSWEWKHPGTAVFAISREVAIERVGVALRALQYPTEVILLFLEEIKKKGEPIQLFDGFRFAAQIGGGDVVHGFGDEDGGVVAFGYYRRGLGIYANAERWQVTWNSKVYSLVLPDVCYNFTREREHDVPKTPLTPAPVAAAPAPSASAPPSPCPNPKVRFVIYKIDELAKELQAETNRLIAVQEARDSEMATRLEAYRGKDFSRTLGLRLWKEVKPNRWSGVLMIRVFDPKTKQVISDPKFVTVTSGIGDMPVPSVSGSYVLEAKFPDNFRTVTTWGLSGERVVRTFSDEILFCTNLVSAGF